MTRTTISFTREGMKQIQKAARRQGSSVSQFVREAALMRARMASDNNPYGIRASREGAQGRRGRGRAQALSPPRQPRIAFMPAAHALYLLVLKWTTFATLSACLIVPHPG